MPLESTLLIACFLEVLLLWIVMHFCIYFKNLSHKLQNSAEKHQSCTREYNYYTIYIKNYAAGGHRIELELESSAFTQNHSTCKHITNDQYVFDAWQLESYCFFPLMEHDQQNKCYQCEYQP